MRLLERNAKREGEAFLEGDLAPAAVLKLNQWEFLLAVSFKSSLHKLRQDWLLFVSIFGMWLVTTSCIMRLPGNN